MAKMNFIDVINTATIWLVSIGAINWLLGVVADFDLVQTVFGTLGWADAVYSLVGIAGIYLGILVATGKVSIKK